VNSLLNESAMSLSIHQGLKYYDAYSFTMIKIPMLSKVVTFMLWPTYIYTLQAEGARIL
jgi:hypothetical protein